jgi:hypothetical protein
MLIFSVVTTISSYTHKITITITQEITSLVFVIQPPSALNSTEGFSAATVTARLLQVKVKVILRLAVYLQSVHLGVRPFEVHDKRFF